jgi:hypothetical protein
MLLLAIYRTVKNLSLVLKGGRAFGVRVMVKVSRVGDSFFVVLWFSYYVYFVQALFAGTI